MMRLKFTKLLTLCIVAANVCLVYFTLRYFADGPQRQHAGDSASLGIVTAKPAPPKPRDRIQSANRHLKKMITVVFRDIYFFDTDLQASIESILALIPSIQVLVVYDDEPYPPLDFVANLTLRGNVQFISCAFDVFRTSRTASPLNQIRSRYTLIVPDSWRLGGRSILQKMLREIEREPIAATRTDAAAAVVTAAAQSATARPLKRMLIVPFGGNIRTLASCCRLQLGFANWTLEYRISNGTTGCDMYVQKHGILLETALLRDMADPLLRPFPEMLYVQAKIAGIQKIILPATMQDGKRLFAAVHNKKRKKDMRRQLFRDMYRRLQIKKVIRKVPARVGAGGGGGGGGAAPAKPDKLRNHPAGGGGGGVKNIDLTPPRTRTTNGTGPATPLVTSVEFYGCERNTRSCIGTVIDARPFFVHLGRHTPPCCAEKLKAVVHHVLDELLNVGIRFWLDNAALRSAIDTNGLAADAFEVDVGFYEFDLQRSETLRKCQTRPLSDEAGFYWMKATDGNYFRVLFSKANQVGVNLLPFELAHDRVRPSGFYGWKAKEFPSKFVHPMSNVVFLGKNWNCPNNVREFLELKNL